MLRKVATICLVQVLLLYAGLALSSDLPDYFVTFNEAEELALKNSYQITSQKYIVESVRAKAFAEQVKVLPNITFGANSLFQSQIGKINFPQLGINRDIGDHINWSVGPVLKWVLWDTGQILNRARSLDSLADSETENLDYDSRQVLLNARTSYIEVQLAKEQVMLVSSALRLARAQYKDVLDKKTAGTADLLDLTVAHQEVVDREKDLEQAKGELAITKRSLVAALGYNPETEDCDKLDVESIGKVLDKLLPRAYVPVDVEAHPQVKALADKERSFNLAAKSSNARHFPEINVNGSSTFEYPNLGDNQTIQQNKMMLGLSVPVLDWGTISKETKSQKYQARSAAEQKKQTIIDLSRVTSETREKIQTLKDLRVANRRSVSDAVAVAGLTYDSYQAGRVIFLDVQRANVKALSAKVDAARNDAALAIQISNLLALAESEGGFNEQERN